MKPIIVIAGAAALALVSAAAFAQMRGGPNSETGPGSQMMQGQPGKQGPGMMHQDMRHGQGAGPGQGPGMMREGMMPGGSGMQGGHATSPKGDSSASSLAFNAVNMKMHAAMDIAYSGDADVDFAKAMIPHHQGAIDMAKLVLAFGKDPEIKKLAEGIIKAQDAEIAWMTDWLRKTSRQ